MKINHKKLDFFSKDPSISDFQRYYITESFKYYIGLENEFINLSSIKINEKVLSILEDFGILEEE